MNKLVKVFHYIVFGIILKENTKKIPKKKSYWSTCKNNKYSSPIPYTKQTRSLKNIINLKKFRIVFVYLAAKPLSSIFKKIHKEQQSNETSKSLPAFQYTLH